MIQWKALLDNSLFLKKLNKFLLIGFSTLLLIYIGGVGGVNVGSFQALADCSQQGGCPPPQEQPPEECPLTPTLNECTGCHTANTVSIDCNGNRVKTGETTDDSCDGSAWGCPVPPPPPTSPPTPQPPASQPPAPAPQPVCVKPTNPNPPAGCFGGLCCAVCGDKTCDGFNGENVGNCAQDCAAPAAPAQPAPQQPAQQQSNNQTNNQPVTVVAHGGNAVAEGGSATAVASGNTQIGGNQNQAVNNPTPAPSAAPTATPTPSPTPTPVPAAPAPAAPAGGTTSSSTSNSSSNNTNTNSSSSTNTNTITIGSAAVPVRVVTAQAQAAQPRVVVAGVSSAPVTQLPKTGLPAIAWALISFLPLGLRVKKFGLGPKGSDRIMNRADNICQQRDLRKIN